MFVGTFVGHPMNYVLPISNTGILISKTSLHMQKKFKKHPGEMACIMHHFVHLFMLAAS